MPKVLVLYQSSHGHMEQMAHAAAEGARAGGAQVVVKRVPELMSEADARKQGMKWDQPAPWAQPSELTDYDAVILGIPTRYGRMVGPMASAARRTAPPRSAAARASASRAKRTLRVRVTRASAWQRSPLDSVDEH